MSRKELAQYRYEMAREKLEAAKVLLEKGFFRDSISRSYYSVFTSARSLLALKEMDSAKHSGVISLFNRYFIKTQIVDKSCSKILARAKIYRERGDYGDFTIVSKEEAEEQIKNAEIFLKEVKKYLDIIMKNNTEK